MNKLEYIPWRRTSIFKIDKEETLLYTASIKGEGIFKISGIGAFLWKQIDGKTTIWELGKKIAENFEGASIEQIYQDVCLILDQMVEKDIIVYNWDALE